MKQKKLLAVHLNEFNYDYLKYGAKKYKLKKYKEITCIQKN